MLTVKTMRHTLKRLTDSGQLYDGYGDWPHERNLGIMECAAATLWIQKGLKPDTVTGLKPFIDNLPMPDLSALNAHVGWKSRKAMTDALLPVAAALYGSRTWNPLQMLRFVRLTLTRLFRHNEAIRTRMGKSMTAAVLTALKPKRSTRPSFNMFSLNVFFSYLSAADEHPHSTKDAWDTVDHLIMNLLPVLTSAVDGDRQAVLKDMCRAVASSAHAVSKPAKAKRKTQNATDPA